MKLQSDSSARRGTTGRRGVEGNVTDEMDDATWRRQRACDLAFESIAEALVRDQRPGDQHYRLMAVPLLDAFRAGDRVQLTHICGLIERLFDLVPEDMPWSDAFRGCLLGLRSRLSLATQCWSSSASERPTFREIRGEVVTDLSTRLEMASGLTARLAT